MKTNVSKLRNKQDKLNLKIASLLLERLELSLQILKIKSKDTLPSIDPIRELEILKNVSDLTPHPKQKKFLKSIFQLILSQSVEMSRQQKAMGKKTK